jgi:hypothetical protein
MSAYAFSAPLASTKLKRPQNSLRKHLEQRPRADLRFQIERAGEQFSQPISKIGTKPMFQIIEVFLGFSIGIAILWVTVLALVRFTRRVISGEEWQDVLKDLWKKPLNGVLPADTKTPVSEDSRSNGQTRRKNL